MDPRSLGPYGPFGSRAVDACPLVILPNYTKYIKRSTEIDCEKAKSYLTMSLPTILTSNVVFTTDVIIKIQTSALVASYSRNGELPVGPGYVLRNINDSESSILNEFQKSKWTLQLDSFIAYGETFPPVEFLLKYSPKQEVITVSKQVTGSNITLLNVVVVYSSEMRCQTKTLAEGERFVEDLKFKVISITVSFF
jgi:hypothetical protein